MLPVVGSVLATGTSGSSLAQLEEAGGLVLVSPAPFSGVSVLMRSSNDIRAESLPLPVLISGSDPALVSTVEGLAPTTGSGGVGLAGSSPEKPEVGLFSVALSPFSVVPVPVSSFPQPDLAYKASGSDSMVE